MVLSWAGFPVDPRAYKPLKGFLGDEYENVRILLEIPIARQLQFLLERNPRSSTKGRVVNRTTMQKQRLVEHRSTRKLNSVFKGPG